MEALSIRQTRNWLQAKLTVYPHNVQIKTLYIFFSNKRLHAHLQYDCNIPTKYQMNILKALGGVDFTKNALLPISPYVHWKKIGKVQNAVNVSKYFLALNS